MVSIIGMLFPEAFLFIFFNSTCKHSHVQPRPVESEHDEETNSNRQCVAIIFPFCFFIWHFLLFAVPVPVCDSTSAAIVCFPDSDGEYSYID